MVNKGKNTPKITLDGDGLMPPNAIEMEEAVLGSCLLEQDAIHEVIDILTPECFYKEQNQRVWGAILDLYKKSSVIDILTIVQNLKSRGDLEIVGGAYYVSSLTNRIASSANIQFHARIVVEQYLKREMIRLSHKNIKESYDQTSDVFDVYEASVREMEGALSGVIKQEIESIGKVHQDVINESMQVALSGAKSGVPTGFRVLDNFTNGWQKTDLIILAGRTAMGKSVCALAFCANPAINDNIPTAIFSLEMSSEQVVGRLQSTLSGLNSSRIIKKQLSVDEIGLIEKRCAILNTAPIYIDDTPSLSLMSFKNKARKLVRDKKVKLIIVDYLQLMTTDAGKGNREQEVSMISKGLKGLAKELDVPIIALSQLSRAVETRGGDKTPQLSDLRESGSIEQDADMVVFAYRPEYYGIDNYEINGKNYETEGLMSLIIAKHRAGSLGQIVMGFNGELTKLENYDTFMERKNNPYANTSTTSGNESTNIQQNKMSENSDFLSQGQNVETETDPF